MGQQPLQVVDRADGSWAVVDEDEEVLSVHPNEAGAEAERTRLAQSARDHDETDEDTGDRSDLAPEDDPYTDNVGA